MAVVLAAGRAGEHGVVDIKLMLCVQGVWIVIIASMSSSSLSQDDSRRLTIEIHAGLSTAERPLRDTTKKSDTPICSASVSLQTTL